MSYNLGTAEGVITTSYNGKGADAAKKDIDGLQKSTMSTGEAVGKVGNTAGIAGAAIAAANFEQRMSAVQAVSGASGDEMDQLTKKALQLGKDTSFSAGEAALAIEELVKAGVSVPDVMNGAADATVALAAAGEIDLPEAAAIASNAMNQFNLSAQEMPKIADLIAGAANSSAIDVKDFGYSLSQVGAVANLAGASFDDTAAAIALMGNAGIKGSDAGTSLKTMLTNLQPQTTKAANLMKDLGLMTEDGANQFYDAQGNLKSFSDIAGLLQNSLKGLTAQQKQQALTTLFGSDAVRGAAVFANQGAAGFDKMATSMTKIKAADVAKTRLDNFKGSLEAMKGSLETTGIIIGQIFLH
jgi:TP901 family phage tail tape measure protein